MIESAHIKNFQKHKDLKIEFTEGINVITGESDAGKSAVIRALRWVLENRPSGNKFKTKGTAPSTSVNVEIIIDGEEISRTKSTSKNEYFFQGETFKAMGSEVPEPISNFTNISSLNIQRQFDEHFLFQYPDSKVSKMINDVSGMEEIIHALEETNRRVRKGKSEEEFLCELIDEKEKEINKLSKYEIFESKIKKIKRKIDNICDKEEVVEKLRKLLIQTKKIQEEKIHKNVLNKITEKYFEVVEVSYQLVPKIESTNRLKKSIDRYRSLENEPKIKFVPIDLKIQEIKKSKIKLEKKDKDLFSLKKKIEAYTILNEDSLSVSKKLEDLENKIGDLKKRLKICPVCNKRW
jgi:DNA repair exonuclease SbcCD ATPase subunit